MFILIFAILILILILIIMTIIPKNLEREEAKKNNCA